jgi:hypothetical protein
MPVPPPMHDPVHIETRLLVVAEMLERAVAEVRRAMDEIKAVTPAKGSRPLTPPFAAPTPDREDEPA